MRGELLICMRRRVSIPGVSALVAAGFDEPGTLASEAPRMLVCLAAICATFAACGVCAVLTAYVHVCLVCHEWPRASAAQVRRGLLTVYRYAWRCFHWRTRAAAACMLRSSRLAGE